MSKLQNNFTTKEQSNQLLRLGLPRISANLYYDDEDELQLVKDKEHELIERGYFPCWSVGRLMEIYTICYDPDYIEFDTFADGTSFLKQILDRFENCIDSMDFSKLEE